MSTTLPVGDSAPEHNDELKGRVRRLLQFLREIVKARTKPVLRFEQHEKIEWIHQDNRITQLDVTVKQGGIALRAPRITTEDPPELPPELDGWVEKAALFDSSQRELSPNTPGLDRLDSDAAISVREAFATYLPTWRAWATADRERRPQVLLYKSLQLMMQELTSRPESIELVIAAGLLTMPEERIQTHLVTQSASIERDMRTGDLLVRLMPHTHPRLEDTQLFTGLGAFDPSGAMTLQTQLQEMATSPLSPSVLHFLEEWAPRALNQSVDVQESVDQPFSSLEHQVGRSITLSPALVLRKRGAFALVEYYEKMIVDLERDGSSVPLGLAQLVDAIEPEDRLSWLERTGAAASATLALDPLFPLPANAEQSQIIDRLGRDSGVVVEGPPGTGKTHTIANLVSALLARGQRVLVTSEKSQALRVLRDKLPAEMQELCVSITDLSRGGSDELSRSVATIAERKASFNDRSEEQKIENLRAQRLEAGEKRTRVLEQVRTLRESETIQHGHISDGYRGSAASVVRKVKQLEEMHEWLPGPLLTDKSPLTGTEIELLRRLIASGSPTRGSRVRQSLPSLDQILPNRSELEQLCHRVSFPITPETAQSGALMELLDRADAHTSVDVRRLCEQLQARVRDVRELEPKFRNLADAVLSGTAAHLWSRVSGLPTLVESAVLADRLVGAHDIECAPLGRDVFLALDQLATALEGGAELKSRFRKSPQQKAVEELGVEATVDGTPASTAASIRLVAEHVYALDGVQKAATLLADLDIEVQRTGSRAKQVNDLQLVASKMARVSAVVEARDELVQRLVQISPSAPWVASLDDATAIAGAASVITAKADVNKARIELDKYSAALSSKVDPGPSPEGDALIAAIRLGSSVLLPAALTAYAKASAEQHDQRVLDELAGRLAPVAPMLWEIVVETASNPEWDEMSWQLDDAWAWRRARQWVTDQHDEGREQELEAELNAVDADISHLTARLAAASAWRSCLDRMSASEVRALQTYREHISSIGAGTGKYAEKYRSAARSAMREAQSAVPAWVMPLQQVLASIPPEPGSFDVVIVDEASQADITSLFLLWLAPRVIVVGDDKQCAPADVPSNGTLEDVFERLDVYLPDLPEHVRTTLTPRSSLFSMLRTRFGQVVRLREHFRSMPEIINWSSQQFYGDSPLIPVRQFGADRLLPLKHTFVPDAEVTGKNNSLVNQAEARAIVKQIVACLADPAYNCKTFGVVVLQGQKQVDVIRDELLRNIGQEQWEDRRLRVGTPPDFQGDERNVVFLSMVIAPDQNFIALTANEYKRRFNVAASRAQDQLWLFHSVQVEGLKRADLRNSLLSYVSSTSPAAADPMPLAVSRDIRTAPFDNLLEQRVFNDIVAHGYHVNPQIEVNNRRIDLVVTGGSSRLAVECDGDTFRSTPEQRLSDLEREQEIKRCGWTFWRVRESEYYLDPIAAMSTLWDTLESLGIAPHSVVESSAETTAAVQWTPIDLPEDPTAVDDVPPATDDHATPTPESAESPKNGRVTSGNAPVNGSKAATNGAAVTNGVAATNGSAAPNGSGSPDGASSVNGSSSSNGNVVTNGSASTTGANGSGFANGTSLSNGAPHTVPPTPSPIPPKNPQRSQSPRVPTNGSPVRSPSSPAVPASVEPPTAAAPPIAAAPTAPAVAKTVPTVAKPASAAVNPPEPVVSKSVPAVAKSAPAVAKPAPVVAKPASAAVAPSKAVAKPVPAVARPVPAVARPVPAVARPASGEASKPPAQPSNIRNEAPRMPLSKSALRNAILFGANRGDVPVSALAKNLEIDEPVVDAAVRDLVKDGILREVDGKPGVFERADSEREADASRHSAPDNRN